MQNIEQIIGKTKAFIVENTFADALSISNESLIFKGGYLDSMGFISLIVFLENEYIIKIEDRDLIEENFESINAIAAFVIKKKTV